MKFLLVYPVAIQAAPLIKTALMTLGGEEPLATGVSHIASRGASVVVENPRLLKPILQYVPGAQALLGAASLLGGGFAGRAVGGVASRAVEGLIEGDVGNSIPVLGYIIREEMTPTGEFY